MKLIYDKDLGAWIDNWFTTHRYYHPHSRSTSIPISELKDIVEQMPSADAVPVMHGKWIDTELTINYLFYCTCSVCGERQIIEVANYCPMCGAKMDGKEREDGR